MYVLTSPTPFPSETVFLAGALAVAGVRSDERRACQTTYLFSVTIRCLRFHFIHRSDCACVCVHFFPSGAGYKP